MRRWLLVVATTVVPLGAAGAPIEEEVEAAVAAVRAESAGPNGERLGHALHTARRILERVQDLVARRHLARARALLPELRVRVECLKAAGRVLELEERARSLEERALTAEEDARVAKDALERAIEVRRGLEAAP